MKRVGGCCAFGIVIGLVLVALGLRLSEQFDRQLEFV